MERAITSRAGATDRVNGSAGRHADVTHKVRMRGQWTVACHVGRGWRGLFTRARRACYRLAEHYPQDDGAFLRKLGDLVGRPALQWSDQIENLVTNAGIDYLLDAGLSGGTPITTWYLLLTDGTPTAAAGDTAASHAGWTEVTAYDEAARQTWTDGGVSSKSVDNSGSAAVFTISTNSTTVGGCALISVNTKGGTTGTLYAVGAFGAGDKSLDVGIIPDDVALEADVEYIATVTVTSGDGNAKFSVPFTARTRTTL